MSPAPSSVPSSNGSFFRQCARASWMSMAVAAGVSFVLRISAHGRVSGLGGVIVLVAIALLGLGAGIVALFGMRRYGREGILWPALAGICLCVMVSLLATPVLLSSHQKSRTLVLARHSVASEPLKDAPDAVKAPATESLLFAANAKGVQIYECRAKKDDPAKFEWAFKAPEADLFDARGEKIGRHYAGPTWESNDGSKVVGEVKGKADAKDPSGVPWLLLSAKSHEGNGIFGAVSSIQRVSTAGGKAPAEGCDGTTVGKELRVPYTAVYYFYMVRPGK